MYKFDVKYTLDNYFEYYKFLLVKQRILRDVIFGLVFVGVAIYFWVDQTEATSGNIIPIFSLVMGLAFPLMNYITVPMLKKQLKRREDEINKTHLVVTFLDNQSIEEDQVVYENLTERAPELDENGEEKVTENVFKLKYINFMAVKETKGLIMFYLDRQTVIILPKSTYEGEGSIEDFKQFIRRKVNPKRVKFLNK
ncbi:MAG: YcxB family protein [Bacilli bacterium]|nr:YcxB family protein [Bacilli bacterium]